MLAGEAVGKEVVPDREGIATCGMICRDSGWRWGSACGLGSEAYRREPSEETMTDWTMIRERYMRDEPPVRLGGLAANLARIASFSDNARHRMPVIGLIVESQHFIE